MKVRRVNTGRRLETLVIDIFSKFFFYVTPNTSLGWTEGDERDI